MRQPLIKGESKTSHHFFHALIFTFVSLIFVHFLFKQLTHLAYAELKQEEAVSASFGESVLTYFALGHLPNTMELHKPYKGPDTLLKLLCPPTTPTCRSVCEKRAEPIQPKTKLPKEPEECIFENEKQVRECLITYTMRCWRGGASVFDGSHEWTLIFHEESSESDSQKVPWIHLTSHEKRVDAFVFGWNENYSGADPCQKFLEASKLLHKLDVAQNDFEIMMGGHGSGALWAHCANLRLAEMGRPPQLRKVINSGMPMVSIGFVHQYLHTVEPEFTILNLLVASNLAVGLLADLKPILPAPAGFHTLPTFGYSCSSIFDMRLESLTCVDPQPEVNIDNSVLQVLPLVPEAKKDEILQTLHSFSMYKACFRACRQQFQRDGFTFQGINVPAYERAEEVIEMEGDDEAGPDNSGSSQNVLPPNAPPGLTELIRPPPSTSSGSATFYDRSRDPRPQRQQHRPVQPNMESLSLSERYSGRPEGIPADRSQSPRPASDEDSIPPPAPHLRNAMD